MLNKFYYALLFFLILGGCNAQDNQEQQTPMNDNELKIFEEYKKLNSDGFSDIILFKFSNDFPSNETSVPIHDSIIDQYNIAVENLFKDSIHTLSLASDRLNYSVLNERLFQEITESKTDYISKTKENLIKKINDGNIKVAYEIDIDDFLKEDEEIVAINSYVSHLYQVVSGGEGVYTLLSSVHPTYKGTYFKEIREIIFNAGYDVDRWTDTYNYSNDIRIPNAVPPALYMTIQEVLNSTWGKPQSINKTTSIHSIREQWVYENYNYLYFEDGILISIQESN